MLFGGSAPGFFEGTLGVGEPALQLLLHGRNRRILLGCDPV